MVAGDDVVGVIVLSSLGYGMFDDEDQRMLEVLAPHAAAAFQGARLLEAERGAAQAAGALLQLSQALTARHTLGDIFHDAIETIPTIIRCSASAAYVRDAATGDFRLAQAPRARRDRAARRAQTSQTCRPRSRMPCCRATPRRS